MTQRPLIIWDADDPTEEDSAIDPVTLANAWHQARIALNRAAAKEQAAMRRNTETPGKHSASLLARVKRERIQHEEAYQEATHAIRRNPHAVSSRRK